MKQKVLLLQQELRDYRTPLFNALSSLPEIDLTIATFSEPEKSKGIKFNFIRLDSRKITVFETASGLKKLASNHDVIVVPFNLRLFACVRLLFNSKIAKKTILWGHSHGRNSHLQALRNRIINITPATLLYTDYDKKRLILEGSNEEKLFVARNTVQVNNAEFRSEIKRSTFLFVGRLQARKGINELFRAFANVKSQLPSSIKIEVVGDGDRKSSLTSLASQLKIADRVVFHGKVLNENKLKDIFSRSIAYVSPNHVGLGIVHSFAYGVPAVTTDHNNHAPEFRYIENNVNGILYDGEVNELAKLLVRMGNETKLSYDLGRNAFEYFERCLSLSNFTKGFERAINKCLGD